MIVNQIYFDSAAQFFVILFDGSTVSLPTEHGRHTISREETDTMTGSDRLQTPPVGRRTVLIGAGLAVTPVINALASTTDPTELPPQPGDQFTFLAGARKGQVIKAEVIGPH
jgi:hypothetical protein